MVDLVVADGRALEINDCKHHAGHALFHALRPLSIDPQQQIDAGIKGSMEINHCGERKRDVGHTQ